MYRRSARQGSDLCQCWDLGSRGGHECGGSPCWLQGGQGTGDRRSGRWVVCVDWRDVILPSGSNWRSSGTLKYGSLRRRRSVRGIRGPGSMRMARLRRVRRLGQTGRLCRVRAVRIGGVVNLLSGTRRHVRRKHGGVRVRYRNRGIVGRSPHSHRYGRHGWSAWDQYVSGIALRGCEKRLREVACERQPALPSREPACRALNPP